MPTAEHDSGPPPLGLEEIPPRAGVLDRPEIQAIESWLRGPAAAGALWVHGLPGSGRTTAVAAALRRAPPERRALKRVACSEGVSVEEVLYEASAILRQVGSEMLSQALDQRVPVRSKITVLLHALRETRVVIWLDDFDVLLARAAEPGRGQDSLEYLLEGSLRIPGASPGRIIFVADAPPPAGFPAVHVGGLLAGAAERLWSSLAGKAGGARAEWNDLPLPILLLARARAKLDDAAFEELVRAAMASDPVRAAVEAAMVRLTREARLVLEAASAIPPEPTRQALREVAASHGVEIKLGAEGDDLPLRELEDWGLVELSPRGSREGRPLSLHPGVRGAVAERLRARSPEVWQGLQAAVGAYFIRLAAKSAHLWHLVQGWRGISAAGLHEDAYEIQRAFVQELVRRGHLDPARVVLAATAGTTEGLARTVALGNLAIIHKNTGDYDGALEIYGQARNEFLGLGDAANAARVLHQIGNTQYLKGDHAAALESYRVSLETSVSLGDRAVSAATRIQIANVLFQTGDLDSALRSYIECAEEARALGDPALVAAVELQLSRIHLQQGRYMEAEAHLREAESRAGSSGDLKSLIRILEMQAVVAARKRDYDRARERHDEALRAAEALGDAIESARCLVQLGDMERGRLRPAEALAAYERSIAILEGNAAQAGGADAELSALREGAEGRVRAMEQDLGPETFRRLARGPKKPRSSSFGPGWD
jgi:tetratricopeptide (TPR) repeat protein